LPAWHLFARRAQRNPTMAAFVIARDRARCCWCGAGASRSDGGLQIHHRDYNHVCCYGRTIVVATPTAKRPGRVVEVPDCAACQVAEPDLFASWASRLASIHGQCDRLVEETACRSYATTFTSA
jgi:hypothetical protein